MDDTVVDVTSAHAQVQYVLAAPERGDSQSDKAAAHSVPSPQ